MRWIVLLWIVAQTAFADDLATKVIQLRYIQANEVMALMQPMLGSGEQMTGNGQTLMVKAGPQTLSSIREVLHRLDVPPVTFDITVYQGDPNFLSSHNDNTVSYSTQSQAQTLQTQSVRVMSGGAAVVSSNQEVPVVSSVGIGFFTGVDYQQHQIKNGFVIKPELQGSQVKLTITKLRQQMNSSGGQQFDNQAVATTLMVPMNKWVLLGSAQGAAPVDNNAVISTAGRQFTQNSSLYVKVKLANQSLQ